MRRKCFNYCKIYTGKMLWFQKRERNCVEFVLLIVSSVTYLSSCVLCQDIIFADADSEEKIPSALVYRHNNGDQKLVAKSSSTENETNGMEGIIKCEKLCIPLEICFSLSTLQNDPIISTGFKRTQLKDASCGSTDSGGPLVWCEDAICYEQAQVSPIPRDSSEESYSQSSQSTSEFLMKENDNSTQALPSLSPQASPLNDESCGKAFPARIHGGEDAAAGEFPWVVALILHTPKSQTPKIMCGGTLISDQWVITAAHCVLGANNNLRNISYVRVGAHNISNTSEEGAENFRPIEVLFHDGFQERPTIRHDIALIKLEKKVTLSWTVGTICVPDGNGTTINSSLPLEESETLISTTIVGWGGDGSGYRSSSDILQKTEIPLIRGNMCKRIFNRHHVKIFPDHQICAGAENKDSCRGDSGGPLMTTINGRQTIIGIVSFGTVLCDGSLPGVYTRVLNYMNWVREKIFAYSK